ncbi:hypothetical protein HYH03_002446 [Edaphochlamys debaryana]|uniref:Plastid lipid-associated protein/fibrillin conserved domain-containing protein n=1 Tax=Edaphochlamys debaryana TaxID=47281 RepID=A0A835YD36_9CHLO|nr:hypothetical protein HYH03_002446 [Edaphochlamys debaryana]|eukprot:KAG2499499.1 hypothetical protein HYH03_002446 [Edaphochlamys debaryana]
MLNLRVPARGYTNVRRARATLVIPLAVEAGVGSEATARVVAKARLRQLVSKINAAAAPGPADLAALDATLGQLARLSPVADTATDPAINGRWVLLYTASLASLRSASSLQTSGSGSSRQGAGAGAGAGSARPEEPLSTQVLGRGLASPAASPLQMANDVAYQFFYTYVPFLAGAAVGVRGGASAGPVKPRGNFQVFDTAAGTVENQARFDVGGRQCCVNVNGTAKLVKPGPGRPSQRLAATFTSFDLVVDGERRLSLPLSLLNPVGYVDTPYLDEDIRISVGDKGSVFVAARDTGAA